jgi:hypothetical protein
MPLVGGSVLAGDFRVSVVAHWQGNGVLTVLVLVQPPPSSLTPQRSPSPPPLNLIGSNVARSSSNLLFKFHGIIYFFMSNTLGLILLSMQEYSVLHRGDDVDTLPPHISMRWWAQYLRSNSMVWPYHTYLVWPLLGMPKTLLYCTEYKRPTTEGINMLIITLAYQYAGFYSDVQVVCTIPF